MKGGARPRHALPPDGAAQGRALAACAGKGAACAGKAGCCAACRPCVPVRQPPCSHTPVKRAGGAILVHADGGSGGLSGGAWAGIAIGIAVAVAAAAGAAAAIFLRRRRAHSTGSSVSAAGRPGRGTSTDSSSKPAEGEAAEASAPSLELLRRQQAAAGVDSLLRLRFGGLEGLELGSLVGRGAFGRVYNGRLRGVPVAVKASWGGRAPGACTAAQAAPSALRPSSCCLPDPAACVLFPQPTLCRATAAAARAYPPIFPLTTHHHRRRRQKPQHKQNQPSIHAAGRRAQHRRRRRARRRRLWPCHRGPAAHLAVAPLHRLRVQDGNPQGAGRRAAVLGQRGQQPRRQRRGGRRPAVLQRSSSWQRRAQHRQRGAGRPLCRVSRRRRLCRGCSRGSGSGAGAGAGRRGIAWRGAPAQHAGHLCGPCSQRHGARQPRSAGGRAGCRPGCPFVLHFWPALCRVYWRRRPRQRARRAGQPGSRPSRRLAAQLPGAHRAGAIRGERSGWEGCGWGVG